MPSRLVKSDHNGLDFWFLGPTVVSFGQRTYPLGAVLSSPVKQIHSAPRTVLNEKLDKAVKSCSPWLACRKYKHHCGDGG